MKRLFLITLWIFILTSVVSAGTTTTNYSLYKPAVGETGWGASVNTNMDTIDTQMKTNSDATALNTTHSSSDGSDHSDVVTNSAKVTNATHTGDVTGATALTIADDKVLESHLKAVDVAVDEECLTYEATTGDFEWQTCGAGSGDVVGPASSTDNCFARYNGTTGKLLQDCVASSLDDSGNATFLSVTTTGGGDFTADSVGGTILEVDSSADTLQMGEADGTAYVQINYAGAMTFAGTSDIDLPADSVDEADLKAVNSPTDEYVLTYEATTGDFEWEADQTGGGGGDFTWVLRPEEAKLPSSNPMAIDAGNNKWRGLFDGTTDECATWETVLQPFTGTLKAKVYYTAVSATSGNASFEIYAECTTDGDARDFDTDSFGTADDLTAAVPGTAGYLDVLSDASLNEDSCAEYDTMVVKVCRDADDLDTVGATDLELRKVLIYAE